MASATPITASAAATVTAATAAAAAPLPPLSADLSSSIRSFFTATPEPSAHPSLRRALHAFLSALPAGARVAAVTSGGTTVPLEVNTVRFVDNFSSGARGAATAEHLLSAGYYVVFLHRSGSTLPFVRRVAWLLAQQQQEQQRAADAAAAAAGGASPPAAPSSSATSLNSFAFLRALNIERSADANASARVSLQLGGSAALAQHTARVLESVADYQQRLAARLLPLEFTSVAEYMYALRTLCTGMRDMPPAAPTTDAAAAGSSATAATAAASQRRCMLVLAAAVSDFHIPADVMSVHKLQSRSGPLELRMEQTPKLLFALRHPMAPAAAANSKAASSDAVAAGVDSADDDFAAWYPHGFCVSFKLETDSSLLVRKSRAALRAYRVNLVCANQLHTRYQRLQLIQMPEGERQAQAGDANAPVAAVDDNDGVETVLRDPAPAAGASAQHEFDVEIERKMVQRLVEHHDAWIRQQ